jgi:hypothetical protein
MRFQVPQFIEVEDRIFGPLTISQFIYLAGGFGFLGAMWLILPLWAAIIVGSPVALLGLGLAFYKVNEQPLITVMEHAFNYYLKDKLYIWQRVDKKPEDVAKQAQERAEDPSQFVPSATANKIKDLAWSLDIKESLYSDVSKKNNTL